MNDQNVEELVAKYIRLRDFIKEAQEAFEKQMERPKEAMTKLESVMLAKLSEQGAENIRTGAGTVYRTTRTNVSVADREAFLQAIRDLDWWDNMDVRPAKSVVEEYMKEKGEPFPGVNVTKVYTVGVRRS